MGWLQLTRLIFLSPLPLSAFFFFCCCWLGAKVCVYIYIFNFYNQVQIVWNLGCNNIVEKKKNTMAMGDVFLNINSMFWVIFKPFFSNKDENFISFWSKQKLVLYPFLTKKLCSPMNSFYVSINFFFHFMFKIKCFKFLDIFSSTLCTLRYYKKYLKWINFMFQLKKFYFMFQIKCFKFIDIFSSVRIKPKILYGSVILSFIFYFLFF